jgi:hypothetical protein
VTGPGPVPRRRGRLFWAGTALGWCLILYGLRGVFHHSLDTRPAQLARFWIGGALAHDLLLAPMVLALGVGLARTVPRTWRTTAQRTLIICGPLVLFAYPEVRGYGHGLRNPTSLPHNYTANLLLVIAAVVAATGLGGAIRARRPGPGRLRRGSRPARSAP